MNLTRSGYEFEQPRKAHRAKMFHIDGRSRRSHGCFGWPISSKVGTGAQIRSEQACVTRGPSAPLWRSSRGQRAQTNWRTHAERAYTGGQPHRDDKTFAGRWTHGDAHAFAHWRRRTHRDDRTFAGGRTHGDNRTFTRSRIHPTDRAFANRRPHGNDRAFADGNQKRFSERRWLRKRPLQWPDSFGGSQRHAH